MSRSIISTTDAPAAIGPYSQAIKAGNIVFFSGQTGITPETGKLAGEDVEVQARQVFTNLAAVCEAAGGDMSKIVRIGLFITNFDHFATVNNVMKEFFEAPYPTRTTIAAAGLPMGALVEADAVMVLD